MFRKILVSVLCLILALAMPLSSLAATEVTLKLIPGTELAAADESVSTILNSMNVQIITEDDSFLLGLNSDKGEIASAAIRADETGMYVASAFLGDRVLYFTMEDITAFMVTMMRQSGADEATIAEFEQAMAQATAQQPQVTTAASLFATDGDDVEDAEDMFADDPVMQQFVANLENKMVVTEGTYTDPAFNPATSKTELVMTNEDFMLVMDSQYVKEMYGSMATSAGMTPDELIAMVKDVFSQLDMTTTIVAYANGEDLCAMTMDMVMKGDVTLETTDATGKTTSETETIDIVMDMAANVLTTDAVTTTAVVTNVADNTDANAKPMHFAMNISADESTDAYLFDGTIAEGEENVVLFQGKFAELENDAVEGWLAILAEGDQVTFTLTGKEENDVYEGMLSIYSRSDCTAIVEPTWSDSAILSIALKVQEVETPALLQKLDAATPLTSTQLLKMDETQLNEEISAISSDAVSAMFSALANIPTELLNMLMTSIPME